GFTVKPHGQRASVRITETDPGPARGLLRCSRSALRVAHLRQPREFRRTAAPADSPQLSNRRLSGAAPGEDALREILAAGRARIRSAPAGDYSKGNPTGAIPGAPRSGACAESV